MFVVFGLMLVESEFEAIEVLDGLHKKYNIKKLKIEKYLLLMFFPIPLNFINDIM